MDTSKKYLQKLFLRAERHIKNRNYTVKVVNVKKFKEKYIIKEDFMEDIFTPPKDTEKYFIFDEEKVDEYICNLLIYKWLKDHKDTRYKDFSCILKPNNVPFDMRKISFNELLQFISPQTKKTDI